LMTRPSMRLFARSVLAPSSALRPSSWLPCATATVPAAGARCLCSRPPLATGGAAKLTASQTLRSWLNSSSASQAPAELLGTWRDALRGGAPSFLRQFADPLLPAASIQRFLVPASNVLYVSVVLYGFYWLPTTLMLGVSLLTSIIRVPIMGWLLRAGVAAVSLAAYAPSTVILTVAAAAFAKSSLFHGLALHSGLDRDGDGEFGWRDVLVLFEETSVGRAMGLLSKHDALVAMVPATVLLWSAPTEQRVIIERLERLERKLDAASGSRKTYGAARSLAASAAASSSTASSSREGQRSSRLVPLGLVGLSVGLGSLVWSVLKSC